VSLAVLRVREPPLRPGGEDGEPGERGRQPGAVLALEAADREEQQRGRGPHPVVRPGDRRYQQRGEGVQRQRPRVVGRRAGPPHAVPGQHEDHGGGSQPRGRPGRRARIEPGAGEDTLDRLVGAEQRAPWPAGLDDDGRPVPHRIVPVQREAGRGAGRERDGGRRGGPPVAAAQEEQHERRGGQLHRGGETDERAARPARPGEQAVRRDQRHQQDVDLTVVQRVPHRFEQQRCRQQPPNQPPGSGPRAVPEEQPQHHRGQRDAGEREQRARDGHRHERERRQRHGGDRGIAERKPHAAARQRQHPVQVPVPQPYLAADPVDIEVDPVPPEANPVPRNGQHGERGGREVQRDEQNARAG
jgi:hypothetical protein